MNRLVALIGPMGSGKTAVGRELSALLGWPHRDTDAMVEERARASIAEIFKSKGEEVFRDLEHEALEEALSSPPAVISCGGGIVEHDDNMALLTQCGHVVYLQAEPSELARRVGDDTRRPLLEKGDPEQVLHMLAVRRHGRYTDAATFTVRTDDLSPALLAHTIRQRVHP
jgi:shikimate kinase